MTMVESENDVTIEYGFGIIRSKLDTLVKRAWVVFIYQARVNLKTFMHLPEESDGNVRDFH